MIKTALCFVVSFVIAAACITTVRYASADDAGPVLIEPMAGSAEAAGSAAAPAVTVNAGSGATVVVTPAAATVPDPVEDPGGAIDALWKLYKDGQLTALFYLLGFFALVYAERKIKWLAVGYRKVAVTALVFGAGMLAERAVAGTTPNLSMVVGAIGAAALMAFKAYGAKPTTVTA